MGIGLGVDVGTIGFIGLGNMGGPMARNIAAAGSTLMVADLDSAKVDALVGAGARAGGGVAEVGQHCDIVLTSLPGPLTS